MKDINCDPVPKDGYDVRFVDLNDDGIMDAIALMNGNAEWVGMGGATMFVFRGGKDDSYQFISRNTITRKPIHIRSKKTNGWRDLVVYNSGGGVRGANRLMVFDGQGYPLNPSLQPKTSIIDTDVIVMYDVEPGDAPGQK